MLSPWLQTLMPLRRANQHPHEVGNSFALLPQIVNSFTGLMDLYHCVCVCVCADDLQTMDVIRQAHMARLSEYKSTAVVVNDILDR